MHFSTFLVLFTTVFLSTLIVSAAPYGRSESHPTSSSMTLHPTSFDLHPTSSNNLNLNNVARGSTGSAGEFDFLNHNPFSVSPKEWADLEKMSTTNAKLRLQHVQKGIKNYRRPPPEGGINRTIWKLVNNEWFNSEERWRANAIHDYAMLHFPPHQGQPARRW
ncbi:hypothetical protein BC835DRAFT_1530480 [Cytidiella melzeri]|nr:hypothetical protein BC835DRAFT_1530480 [Cytidiella melzeri]